jgi:hypothetical protein
VVTAKTKKKAKNGWKAPLISSVVTEMTVNTWGLSSFVIDYHFVATHLAEGGGSLDREAGLERCPSSLSR